ncbi:hypothetical protein MMC13_006457 [Lambiella insularis]|nr:hypothetical protein [Lambiella insularis]
MYKINTTLSFDRLLFDMMKIFGLPQALVEKMFQKTAGSPEGACTMHLIHDWQKEQTQGKGLYSIRGCVEKFEKSLALSRFVPQCSYVILATDNKAIVSCKKWTSEIALNAFQSAYFGDSLNVIDPGMSRSLVKFDELSWQIFYQLPRLWSREMYSEKEKITKSFKIYFETPIEKRGEAAYFSQRLEKQYRSLGFSSQEMASLFTVTYWGITSNLYKACFFTFRRIVKDNSLSCAVRHEIAPAFIHGSVSIHHVVTACPFLNAVWLETLRIDMSNLSVRPIVADTVIGGKTLRRGATVIAPARQLHLDARVFGEEPHAFRPQRFLDRPGLEYSPSFRAFGGGATRCLGRTLSKQVVLLFVAIALHRFDIEVLETPPPVRTQDAKGSGSVVGKDDLLLKLTARSTTPEP